LSYIHSNAEKPESKIFATKAQRHKGFYFVILSSCLGALVAELKKEDKMKPFFVRLIVIVISVALVGQVAVTAEVTRVNPSEGHVYVNKGKPAGFIVGAKVCIYLSSEETACGKIFRTTDSYSVLRVDNRKARHIKYGMRAKLMMTAS